MVTVTINANPLRMLGKAFMALIPLRDEVHEGGKYPVEHPEYGKMGEVMLMRRFCSPLYNLTDSVLLISEGDINAKDTLKTGGNHSNTIFQCCTFRFIRRSDQAFKAMIDRELPRAGIQIIRQSSLL